MHIINIQNTLQNQLQKLSTTSYMSINNADASTEELAELFSHCHQIQRITIHNSTIEELPNLQHLKQLKWLQFTCAQLKRIEKDTFPDSLQEIRCTIHQDFVLPDFMWTTLQLKKLTINCYTTPNLTIPAHNQVKELYLYMSALTTITFQESQVHLTHLQIQASQLKNLDHSFNHCVALTNLSITAPIETVHLSFASFTKLYSFKCTGWNRTSYDCLSTLSKKLNNLEIVTPQCRWQQLPDLSQWPELKSIRIESCEDTVFPTLNAPHLSIATIKNAKFVDLPRSFKFCNTMHSFTAVNVPSFSLKEAMLYLSSVRWFSCSETPLTDYDEVTNKICDWENVCLSSKEANFENLDFLDMIPKLTRLDIGVSKIASPLALLRNKTIPFTHLNIAANFRFKNHKQFCVLASAVAKAKISQTDKAFFMLYFANLIKLDINKKWDWATILKATNISHAALKKKLQTLLDEKAAAITPNFKNAVVYITGKPKVKKTTFKKQVEELGMTYTTKYTDAVTHILVGMGSKDYDLLVDKTFVSIAPAQIQQAHDALSPQFLVEQAATESGEQMMQNLGQLLRSPDVEMVKVGLEIIKNGGTPPQVFEDLLIVQKTTTDAKIRKQTKNLLETHAPLEWRPVVRDRLSFKMVHSDKPESYIRRQFKALAQRTSTTMAGRLSCLMYRNTGRGLRFALTARVGNEVRAAAYRLILNDHHLDFSNGLGMRKTQDYSPDNPYAHFGSMAGNLALPVKALNVGTIHSLNLSYCQYHQVRAEIVQFKDLKQLNYAYNDLNHLPDFFSQLQQLETLNLSHNRFVQFPKCLEQLPNLQKIDLRNAREAFKNIRITVPETFRHTHPNCEILL